MKIVLSKDDVTTAITNHIESLGLLFDIKQVTFTGIGDVEVEFGVKKTKKKKASDEPVSTVEAQEEPSEGNDTTQVDEPNEAVSEDTNEEEQASQELALETKSNEYSIFG